MKIPFGHSSLLLALSLLAVGLNAPSARAGSSITPFLRKTLSWHAPKLGTEISLAIYSRDAANPGRKAPVIVYVLNHGAPRIGREADEDILQDYLADQFIIVTADFRSNPRAVSPHFDEDLLALHRALDGYKGAPCIFTGTNLSIDPYEHYFLPAGYRLARGLVYFENDRHGSWGTLEQVLSTWNTILTKRKKLPRLSDPRDMKRPDGSALDWRLRMDVIYPSSPAEPVPLFVYASTQSIRMRCFRTELDAPHFYGFAMRGYACALIDHCWNPLARDDAYGFFNGPYSLNRWNGLKAGTAAIRYLNSRVGEFGHDPNRIGVMGYSKGAYTVTRLSDPDHESQAEWAVFDPKLHRPGTPEPQPWPGFSSRIHCGYQAMGDGTREYERFITNPNYVPQVITAGEFDKFGYWAHWPGLLAHFEKNRLPHLALPMPGKEHILIWGHDSQRNIDRYAATMEYFDQHLKPAKSNAAR